MHILADDWVYSGETVPNFLKWLKCAVHAVKNTFIVIYIYIYIYMYIYIYKWTLST
jgi:hypothetical protein